jgi:hypothetical protein
VLTHCAFYKSVEHINELFYDYLKSTGALFEIFSNEKRGDDQSDRNDEYRYYRLRYIYREPGRLDRKIDLGAVC